MVGKSRRTVNRDHKMKARAADISPRYLTPQQGAEYLSVSLRTMRTLLAKREISYIQPFGKGGMVRLDVRDLDAYMTRNKVHCLDNAHGGGSW
jgi:excisionase family DNA binding protein